MTMAWCADEATAEQRWLTRTIRWGAAARNSRQPTKRITKKHNLLQCNDAGQEALDGRNEDFIRLE